MLVIALILFGLAVGSFVNALVWRLHQQLNGSSGKQLSISKGRSMCPNCRHELSARDLVPVLSWLALGGKCRYCRIPISIQYPIVELALPAVFVTSYLWWPGNLDMTGQKLLLAAWLVCAVGLLALLVYDLRWMLLPNRLIYPTLVAALIGRLSYIAFFSNHRGHDLWLLVFSLAIASGVFWLIFMLSSGKWIGFGDVRLGLITGTLLADPKLSFLMIFLASLIGLLALLSGVFGGHLSWGRKIPFGPFLIVSTWLTILFGQQIINWYSRLLS